MLRLRRRMDPRLQRVGDEIQRYYRDRLIAIALFGSRARSRSRLDSDWDLLLVMATSELVRRRLYREWDERVMPTIEVLLPNVSPHFVQLPSSLDEPSSLWLEVASAQQILSDPTGALGSCIRHIKQAIDAGRYERRAVHGLSYWRRAG